MTATLLRRSHSHGVAAARRVARDRRHFRIRKKIAGTASLPRLVVTRSLRHIRAQLVDDANGHTVLSASSMEASLRTAKGTKTEIARQVGSLIGERAKAVGIEHIVFDRSGNAFHGRIAALAEAAREKGLEF